MSPNKEYYLAVVSNFVAKLQYLDTAQYHRQVLVDHPLTRRIDLANYLEGITSLVADHTIGALPLLTTLLRKDIPYNPTTEYYQMVLENKNEQLLRLADSTNDQQLADEQKRGFIAAVRSSVPMIAAAFYRDPQSGDVIPEVFTLNQLSSEHGLSLLKYRISQALRGDPGTAH